MSRVLGFGDAAIGRSRLPGLAAHLLVLCQGGSRLPKELIDSYYYWIRTG